MNKLEFSNSEITLLLNLLNKGLFYSRRDLETWEKVASVNPSSQCCVDDIQSEISACSRLIEKIQSVRGF